VPALQRHCVAQAHAAPQVHGVLQALLALLALRAGALAC
jgi:hypothetical protein